MEAVEECCVEWHRLLPVLLPAVSPDARLAPSAFFRPCPAPGGGPDAPAASAAAVLLSYISYPYFGSSQRALVMRSMHCLAAAAAATAPGAVFAVLLPQEGPEAGVASAARGAITAAFSPEAAAATPELLSAACDALVTAVECHPSLLDALLFPCGLEQALLDKVCVCVCVGGGGAGQGGMRCLEEGALRAARHCLLHSLRAHASNLSPPPAAHLQENTSSNAAALPAPGDAGKAGGNGGGKGGKAPAPRSCLDALWELLQRREQLQKEHPAVLAKLLQVGATAGQRSGRGHPTCVRACLSASTRAAAAGAPSSCCPTIYPPPPSPPPRLAPLLPGAICLLAVEQRGLPRRRRAAAPARAVGAHHRPARGGRHCGPPLRASAARRRRS